MRWRASFGLVLTMVAVTGGCASSSTGSVTTTHPVSPKSLDVTPCNYARVWRDNPSQFVEYPTLARFAQRAADTALRGEGQQLAAAIADRNQAALTEVAGNVVSTCERLGLVSASTTG